MSPQTDVVTLAMSEVAPLVISRKHTNESRICRVFAEILQMANEFVPSEAGSVSLDDPSTCQSQTPELVFVASFGVQSDKLPGTRLQKGKGIAWHVYSSGIPCLQNDVENDPRHNDKVDHLTEYTTRSMLCLPIFLQSSVCGVLTLINCLTPGGFQQHHLKLMTTFSRYITTSMQNMIDAARLEQLASRDHLTGLYNDRYFFERLGAELQRAEREKLELGLLFFDLDHFKGVVDMYGHLVGGQVLQEVGWLFRSIVTDQRAILARYGGDEYTAILPDIERADLIDLAESVRVGIEATVFLTGDTIDGRPPLHLSGIFTASIGLAYLSDLELTGEDSNARRNRFIRYADEAMYAAKARGKNQISMAPHNARVGRVIHS